MANSESKGRSKEEIWHLDSGCINHMVGVKVWFFEFNANFREFIKLCDNSTMFLMGKGNVKLRTRHKEDVITDVYYILDLRNNLLIIG